MYIFTYVKIKHIRLIPLLINASRQHMSVYIYVYMCMYMCIYSCAWKRLSGEANVHIDCVHALAHHNPVVTAPRRAEMQCASTEELPLQTHTSHYTKANINYQSCCFNPVTLTPPSFLEGLACACSFFLLVPPQCLVDVGNGVFCFWWWQLGLRRILIATSNFKTFLTWRARCPQSLLDGSWGPPETAKHALRPGQVRVHTLAYPRQSYAGAQEFTIRFNGTWTRDSGGTPNGKFGQFTFTLPFVLSNTHV